jgi:hypothetical protein
MNRRRLKRLISVLETHNDHRLRMDFWYWQRDPVPTEGPFLKPAECRYTACALGTAALDPGFRRAGLRLVTGPATGMRSAEVYFKGEEGYRAAQKLFDIGGDAATVLFSPLTYRHVDKRDGRAAFEVINRLQILLNLGEESLVEYERCYYNREIA